MIEEAHLPECVCLLARMTRRHLRLASLVGHSSNRPLPSWRNRIAEFFPATAAEAAPIDHPPIAVAADAELVPAEPVEEYDPFAIPAIWAERAQAELERQQSADAADSVAREEMPVGPADLLDGAQTSVELPQVAVSDGVTDFAGSALSLGIFGAAGAPTGGLAAPGSVPPVKAPAALETFSRSLQPSIADEPARNVGFAHTAEPLATVLASATVYPVPGEAETSGTTPEVPDPLSVPSDLPVDLAGESVRGAEPPETVQGNLASPVVWSALRTVSDVSESVRNADPTGSETSSVDTSKPACVDVVGSALRTISNVSESVRNESENLLSAAGALTGGTLHGAVDPPVGAPAALTISTLSADPAGSSPADTPAPAVADFAQADYRERPVGHNESRADLLSSLVTLRDEVAAPNLAATEPSPALQTASNSDSACIVGGQVVFLPPSVLQERAEDAASRSMPPEGPVLEFGRGQEAQALPASTVTALHDPELAPTVDRSVIVPIFVVHPPLPAAASDGSTSATAAPAFAPAEPSDYNRVGLNYRRPMPRPKVNGFVVDFHCHLLAARHAPAWFEAADHFGIDCFVTMTPLEEAAALQRDWGGRLQLIAVPTWGEAAAAMSPAQWVDDFLVRLEAFYNLGSRIVKFHAAPGTQVERGIRLDSPLYKPLFREVVARKMGVMTHIGDSDLWYRGKYSSSPESAARYGNRDDHYQMWEALLAEYPGVPWIGAHLGGNPEDPSRLQRLLDRFPDLWLDSSATRWMAREVSRRRDAVREFFVRNRDRLLFGTDQVSTDDRGFDFLASRFWTHRKLWETAYVGPSPIADPDLPPEEQPMLRGLALPDQVLQSLYHDNAVRYLAKVGAGFGGWG